MLFASRSKRDALLQSLPASRNQREQQGGKTVRSSLREDRNVRGEGGVTTYALLRNLDFSFESDWKLRAE